MKPSIAPPFHSLMRAVPRVVEVRGLARRRLVEGNDQISVGVERVGVAGGGLGLVGGLALGVELAEVVVRGAVLLHEDEDVVDVGLEAWNVPAPAGLMPNTAGSPASRAAPANPIQARLRIRRSPLSHAKPLRSGVLPLR